MMPKVTVYTVLSDFGITNNDTVGVVGIGGLGHLAIQFASKMGCDVVAFSSGESKREDAMKLGASSFVATKGKESLDLPRKLTHLIVTAGVIPDWSLYLPILAPRAAIYPLAIAPGGQLTIPYIPFVLGGYRMQGSIIGTRFALMKMLDFAARTGVRPVVQKYEFSEKGIDQAFSDLDSGKTRFRGVLVIDP
jgi:D-arabinose 1-dehydrogenase-like Zn-dependent alcohol dehydrogenase